MNSGQSNNSSQPRPFTFNKTYPTTKSAILKVVQMVVSLVALLCALYAPFWTTSSYAGLYFFTIIFLWFMWSAVISYLLILLNLHHRAWWHFVEFVYLGLAALVIAISSIVALTYAVNTSIIFAGVFGLFTSLLFGVESFCSFKVWRQSMSSPSSEGEQIYL